MPPIAADEVASAEDLAGGAVRIQGVVPDDGRLQGDGHDQRGHRSYARTSCRVSMSTTTTSATSAEEDDALRKIIAVIRAECVGTDHAADDQEGRQDPPSAPIVGQRPPTDWIDLGSAHLAATTRRARSPDEQGHHQPGHRSEQDERSADSIGEREDVFSRQGQRVRPHELLFPGRRARRDRRGSPRAGASGRLDAPARDRRARAGPAAGS